jgi:hypothetical protein
VVATLNGEGAREQNERRRRVAEVLDTEGDAIGLDRRHEAGADAGAPSGVRSGRTVGCIDDLQDCGIASIDRPNASNSSLVRHYRSSAAARREDLLGGRHTDVRRSCPRLLEAGSAHRNTGGVVLTGDDQSAVGRSFARRARREPVPQRIT